MTDPFGGRTRSDDFDPESIAAHTANFGLGMVVAGIAIAILILLFLWVTKAIVFWPAPVFLLVVAAAVLITAPIYALGYRLQRRLLGRRRALPLRRDRIAGFAFGLALFGSAWAGPVAFVVAFLGPVLAAFFAAWLDNPFARLDRPGRRRGRG